MILSGRIMTTSKILTHPSEAELASAVQENLYALFRSMQSIPGCELVEGDGLSLHYAPLPNPMFRGVWQTRLSAEEVDSRINDVVDWFKERQAPDFFWWTDADTQPLDLVDRLLQRGFDGNLEGDPGMVADLHDLPDDVQIPPGLTIVQATEPRTLADWRDLFAAAYDAPLSAGQAWVDATLACEADAAPWQLYVGYLDHQPVSTSLLFKGAGVADIYAVGTLPGARNRGIGAAMTLYPLREACAQGYRFAVLFSSRIGYRVYKRLGFREVASKIGIYMFE
jgi:ribosomal protein S18 acetylase RimI-like enzyme